MARAEDKVGRSFDEPASSPLVIPSPPSQRASRPDTAHTPRRGGHSLADIPIHDMGPERRLESGVASRMGAAFGDEFSEVRVHTGPQAGRFVAQQQAIAATVGSHVAFAPGAYRPGTAIGDALLAHELAHVQQQRGATSSSTASAAHEDDAHEAAAAVVGRLALGSRSPLRPRANPPRVGVSVQGCGRPAWAPEMPEGTAASSKSEYLTAATVEQMLINSRLVGRYVAPQIKTGVGRCGSTPEPKRLVGHTHFHPNSEWEQAYMAYVADLEQPYADRCDKSFTEQEAREGAKDAVGFAGASEIHINEDTALRGILMHEAMHLYSSHEFANAVGWWANEGATEYLAHTMLRDEQGIISGIKYVEAYASVKGMIEESDATNEMLAEAYFTGNIDHLREAVDAGYPGRFDQWVSYMDQAEPDYSSANGLFFQQKEARRER